MKKTILLILLLLSVVSQIQAAPGSTKVSWKVITNPSIVSYTIWRGTSSGKEIVYTSVPLPGDNVTTMSYTDVNVIAGAVYFYKVSAVTNKGTGKPSSEIRIVASPAAIHAPAAIPVLPVPVLVK